MWNSAWEKGESPLIPSTTAPWLWSALPFPLLSDVHRKVIQAYNVWDEERNVAYRSTAIVDRDGKLRWSQSGDRLMTRSGAEIRRVLELIGRLRAAG